ncbi:MAG: carboxypeptidase-like regulatory domain-containing protein [Acidobacteriota bacterium]
MSRRPITPPAHSVSETRRRTTNPRIALALCTALALCAWTASAQGSTEATGATDASKTVGGILTGTVSAPGGAVLEFPQVFLFDAAGPSNQPLDVAVPNTEGVYTFKGLATGDYKVAFSGRQGLDSYFEYYDDVPNGQFDLATPVAVIEGQTTSGIDGVLGLAPGGVVEGFVSDPYGRAFDYGFVTAFVFESGAWVESGFREEIVWYEGTYSFRLPAGIYRLFIEAGSWLAPGEALTGEFWPEATTVDAAQDIVVAVDQTVRGIDAVLGDRATGSIAGTLTDSAGAPVSGAEVRVYDRSLGELYDAIDVTGPSGTFQLDGLWPEEYFVDVFDPLGRYEPTFFGGLGASGQPVVRIPVAEGAAVTNADITLDADDPATPNGSIAGLVTNAAGLPLRDARVSAVVSAPCAGHPADTGCLDVVARTRTTDLGTYRLRGLAPGTVAVRFADPSGLGLTEFYDDQPTFDAADLVAVVGPAVEGIDAQLGLAGLVEGTVLDVDGDPFGILFAGAYQLVDGEWTLIDSDVSFDGDGSWRIGSLPAGDYVIRFDVRRTLTSTQSQFEFYDDRFSFDSADPVTVVAGQTTTGIDAVIGNMPPGGIAGSLLDPTGAPVTTGFARAWDERLLDPVATVDIASDGSFEIAGLFPGTYYLELGDASGTLPREWWNDVPTSAWAAPVVVGATVLTGFDVELGATAGGPGGGALSGLVTDADTDLPIPDLVVACFAVDFAPTPICRGTTGADGRYTIGGNLPAGDYVVLAAPEGGYVPEYFEDAAFLEDATAVTLSLGAVTPDIDLELDRPATISGTITAASGSFDVAYADALLEDADGDWRFVRRVEANSGGSYTLDRLAAGTYRVRFLGVSAARPPVVEFYDNEATLDDADDVEADAGQNVTGIDAVLGDLTPLYNPSFEATLDAWTATAPTETTSIVHDAADRFGGDVSGSARFSHDGSIGAVLSLSQCVQVLAADRHTVGAHVRVEGGGPLDPALGLVVESFTDDSCSGAPTARTVVAEHAGPADDWTPLTGTVDLADDLASGTASVRLTVLVDGGAATTFDVWVDDVSLARAGLLFGDGFESGGLGLWSATTGTP